MKIALFCNDDLTTNIIFAPLLETECVDVVGIFFAAAPVKKSRSAVGGALRMLGKMSTRYWLFLVMMNGAYKLFDLVAAGFGLGPRNGDLVSLRALAEKRGIPYSTVADFGSEEFLSHVGSLSIDLLIIRVGAILKPEMLAIPKLGTWCVHSSLLPAFKGIAGEFHALRTENAPIGSTIFEVEPKLDRGPPIAQIAIERKERRSVFNHIVRNNKAASVLLLDAVSERVSGNNSGNKLLNRGLEPSYFSWPSSHQVEEFRARPGKLMTWSEVMLIFCKALRLR